MASLGGRLLLFFRDIKISHSIFAAPFALAAAVVAGGLTASLLGKICLALFLARTSAMAFNRIVDSGIDARNPRTDRRAIPSGGIRRAEYGIYFLLPTVAFVLVCGWINPLCLKLSPVALAILLGYSLTKRFTALTHFFLGLALAAAPIGSWVAVRGTIEGVPLMLGGAVLLWVAGFDLIYSCLDVEFDRGAGLRSVPALLGLRGALRVARACHALAVAGLVGFWALAGLGPATLVGVGAIALLLLYEHRIVRHDDFSRVGTAFFTVNGVVSLLFLAAVAADVTLLR